MAISSQLIGTIGGESETETVSISPPSTSTVSISIPSGWKKAVGIFSGATRGTYSDTTIFSVTTETKSGFSSVSSGRTISGGAEVAAGSSTSFAKCAGTVTWYKLA